MRNRAPGALLTVTCVALLSGCEQHQPTTETFNWKGPVAEGGWVRLRNTSGDFTVTQGTGDSASITLEITRSNSYAPTAQAKVLKVADGILACVVFGESNTCTATEYKGGEPWMNSKLPFFRGRTEVTGTVVLPRGARLDIESVNGDVTVNGAARDVNIVTVNGDVNATGVRGAMQMSTTNGDVDAVIDSMGGGIKASTTNGDVSLTMPATLNASLTMATTNGELDLGITANVTRKSKRQILATLGLGGMPIVVETTNGDVTLRPNGAR
jgi:hypothetical protein